MDFSSSRFLDLRVMQISAQGFRLGCMQCIHYFYVSLTTLGTLYWKRVETVTWYLFLISTFTNAVFSGYTSSFHIFQKICGSYTQLQML